MTNREWFMKVLSQMNDVAFCNFIQDGSLHQYLYWCCDCNQNKSCAECKEKWCNAIHQEEMPELKVGDFVKLKNFGEYLGVIIPNDIIVYSSGEFDYLTKVKEKIVAVYDTNSFNNCDEYTCVWRKVND